jgi:hypothetical protein
MSARAAVDRIESAIRGAGGTFRQTSPDTFRSLGLCHGAQRSESLVILYNGDRGRVGLYCHAACDFDHILGTLGLTKPDLYDEPLKRDAGYIWTPPRPRPVPPKPEPVVFDPASAKWRPPADEWMPCKHPKIAEYLYLDEQDRVVFGVARCERKCFAQWRPVNRRPFRKWSLTEKDQHGNVAATVRTIPFRLPELLAAVRDGRAVFVAEGEKDVLALGTVGLVATCNAGGAGKWTFEHAMHLDGADIVIVADRDIPGRKHAELVVSTLMTNARSIKVVIAKTVAAKDAAGHLAAGYGTDAFVTVWTPKAKEPAQ